MLPGPDLVLACPHCGVPARLPTLASGNTFGATLWSDGWLAAPMRPETPPVTRCPACDTIFWVEDARRLGDFDRHRGLGDGATAPSPWRAAPQLRPLDIEGLAEAVVLTPGENRERVLHLRIRLWQRLNDPHRSRPTRSPSAVDAPGSQLFLRNLERLVALLDAANPDERLMKAEACRQLNRFDEALALLRDVAPAHQAYARQLSNLAACGERGVAKLEMD